MIGVHIRKNIEDNWGYYGMLLGGAFIILFGVMFTLMFKAVFFTALFIFLNFVLAFLLKPFKIFRLGLEVSMFHTVLAGMAYGAKIGMVVGFLAIAAEYVAFRKKWAVGLFVIPSFLVVGYLASFFAGMDVAAVGVWFTVLYNIIAMTVAYFFFGGKPHKMFIFASTNILCNYFLFTNIAPWLMELMI